MSLISLVVPCFNEEANLTRLHTEALAAVAGLDIEVELVLVNDGSRDRTARVAREIGEHDRRVKLVSFSRNFGKEAAMLAGLRAAQGDVVALLDADLQHPPALLRQMYEVISRGEVGQVVAQRTREGDPWLRTQLSKLYYRIVNSLIEVELVDGIGDFRMLSRPAVDALLTLSERNRFSKGLFAWIGFPVEVIQYRNAARAAGESAWTLKALVNYGIDGIVSFNHRPLRLVIHVALGAVALALAYLVWLVVQWLLHGVDAPGYLTTIAVLIGFGGVQLAAIGVIGEYVGRIYHEVKARPHYIVAETVNIDPPAELPGLGLRGIEARREAGGIGEQ